MIYKLECQISSTLMVPIQNRAIAKKIRQEKQKELKNTIQNWLDWKGCQYSGDNLEKIHQGWHFEIIPWF